MFDMTINSLSAKTCSHFFWKEDTKEKCPKNATFLLENKVYKTGIYACTDHLDDIVHLHFHKKTIRITEIMNT